MDNSKYILEFEKPLKDIEDRIENLKSSSINTGVDIASTVQKMEYELSEKRKEIYKNLSRWERVQLARHPKRPYSLDYISKITNYWFELHGDRNFSDDPAIVGGIGVIDTIKVVIIAQEKGRGTKEKVYRNFGMPRPEGYRKAMRIMKLAEKFNFPIVTLLDTPGAYPGVGAEERGQAEAIAKSIECSMDIKVPTISIIIGEGGSGGAIALASSSKVIMLENAIYSVISPEGCATILWRDPKKTLEAATAMKLSSKDLLDLKVIDEIIEEPLGGAHRDKNFILENVRKSIEKSLLEFSGLSREEVFNKRKEKFLSIGRNKGFTSTSSSKTSLSLENNSFLNFVNKFKKKQLIFLGLVILSMLLLGIIFI